MNHSGRDHHDDRCDQDHYHNHDHDYDYENPDSMASEDATIRLSVPDMDCASCAGKVENGLHRVEGVTGYETQPTTGRVVVSSTAARSKQIRMRHWR